MMNKKAVGILICMLLVGTLLPVTGLENTPKEATEASSRLQSDGMPFVHVVATGNGSSTSFGGSFTLGFGTCLAMIVNLECNGYIEISSLIDSSSNVTLEGCHRVTIVGFMGLRWTRPQININGLALYAMWT